MKRSHICIVLISICGPMVCMQPSHSQVVPRVPLPNIPVLPTDDIDRAVDGAVDRVENRTARELRNLRKTRLRALLRANRAAIETDPSGAPILRSEVVALSPTPEALEQARAAGFTVGRTRTLEGLELTIVVLQTPAGMSTRRALDRLRAEDPSGTYDYNHLYIESGEPASSPSQVPVAPATAMRSSTRRVGLIDGGVQKSHPVFAGATVHEHGCSGGGMPSEHGTAVASLLVGEADPFRGVYPEAELFVADVYCGLATGGAVDAIAEAFAWLSQQHVPVINISLVGPPNALLERMIRILTLKGHLVVAAVGNDGPRARPLYPAAYEDVVAVTGVDARNRVIVEACRGKHVDFAAPGSDMSAAIPDSKFGLIRGTSFASPIVAGLLAEELSRIDKQAADAARANLISRAQDLGSRGRDKIYGHGLLGEHVRPSARLAGKSK